MTLPLDPSELSSLRELLEAPIEGRDSSDMAAHYEMVKELGLRAVEQLESKNDRLQQVTPADLNFLNTWLKSRNMIVGSLQLLQLADPKNAASMAHEIECTETAFKILPHLISEAQERL